jgi:dsDNA-specific endonuclease/ATPase MutS2
LQKQPLQELLKRKREEERNLKKRGGGRDLERQVAEGRREIEAIRAQLGESERGLREVEAEAKDQRREIEKEVHYWRKKKKKTQELIKEIEARQDEFFHSFGEMLEERRPAAPGLAEAYREIDLVNQRLDTLQHRLETLGGG